MSVVPDIAAHPLAEIVPPMSEAEFADLRADIEAKGLLHPITLYEHLILDGRHRFRVCRELGVTPEYEDYEGVDPAGFVVSANLKRRHLTVTQRGIAAERLLGFYERKARERMGNGGSAARPGSPAEKAVIQRSPLPGKRLSREEAGLQLGTSGATVDRTRRVKQHAPDLYQKMESGEMTVTAADNELRRRKGPQPGGGQPRPVKQAISVPRVKPIKPARAHELMCRNAGDFNGFQRAYDGFPVAEALSVSSEEDREQWSVSITKAVRVLVQMRRQINNYREAEAK